MKLRDLFRGKSDRDRFADLVIHRAREKGWPHKITYDREKFLLRCGGQDGPTLFLQNVFKDWNEALSQGKQGEIDRLVAGMFEARGVPPLESSLPNLLPIVRNRRELESAWLDADSTLLRDAWDGSYQPLCEALAICVAVDSSSSIKLVGSKILRQWATEFSPLFSRALKNLRNISPVSFEHQSGGFHISKYDDHHDCSRVLVPEIFHHLELCGDPVAVLLARNCMVVAGSEDVGALLAMTDFVHEQIGTATRPISYLPLVGRMGSWTVFAPVDPALAPVRNLQVHQTMWDYASQRLLLEPYLQRTGRDEYVGRMDTLEVGGLARTYSTWGQGVPTLLPRSDAVGIASEDGDLIMRSWEDFQTVCGDQCVDEGLYPVRYLTPPRMTPNQWSRLTTEFRPPVWLPPPKDVVSRRIN